MIIYFKWQGTSPSLRFIEPVSLPGKVQRQVTSNDRLLYPEQAQHEKTVALNSGISSEMYT